MSLRLLLGLAGSLLAHGGLVLLLLVSVDPARGLAPAKDRVVEFEVVSRPPPPPPQPEAEAPPPPRPPPRRRPRPPPRPKPPSPVPELPPPSNDAPPPEVPKKPVPLITGLSLSSTVSAGQGRGMRVAVGNTLYGTPEKKVAVAPEAVQPYEGAEKWVAPHKVSTLPRVLREVKVPYPEGPRQAGIEGTVKLHLLINHLGKVVRVKVLLGIDPALDAAARAALRRARFSPATLDGEPVSTEIDYAYTFLLD